MPRGENLNPHQEVIVFELTPEFDLRTGRGVLWVTTREHARRLVSDPRSVREGSRLWYDPVITKQDFFAEPDAEQVALGQELGIVVLDSWATRVGQQAANGGGDGQ